MDPYTTPIITETEGIANFMDLVDGVSMRKLSMNPLVLRRVVIETKQSGRSANLRPRITLRDEKGNILILSNRDQKMEARYFLPVGAILSIDAGSNVKAGEILARIPRDSSKTRDITGGLPRVAELFEARKPKDFAVISEADGRVEFGADYKAKRRIRVVPADENIDPVEYMLPKGRSLAVNEGDVVRKGDLLLDGSPVPHDILNILGIETLADYLINEVQEVYTFKVLR